jgi:two-component system response regulator AtoC
LDDQNVLVIGSAAAVQGHLLAFLRARGYACVLSTSADEALEPLSHRSFRFTLLDLDLNGTDVADLIHRLKLQPGDPGPIIGLANGSNGQPRAETSTPAVDGLVSKPVNDVDLDKTIAEILAPPRVPAEPPRDAALARIRQEIDLWRSPKMLEVREIIEEAAGVDVTVLITGETGTGKEVVARAVHHLSTRHAGPFVKVNCAAVPRDLLESELFGHERGSFTGAHKLKIGKFESAHHGTIFLDEIGDLHSSLQAKLLHVLQDGDFSRVGGKSGLKVDVRVIAATNQDLERAVAEGRFREDLYYRLNVIHVNVPPLRERVEEIPGLIQYFVQHYSKVFRREGFSIPPPVLERLLQQRYRGNVRELENLVKRMIVLGVPLLTRTVALEASHTEVHGQAPMPVLEVSLKDIARRASLAAEKDAIRKILEQTAWNRVRAAKALRISYRALLYKMKRVGLREEAMQGRPPEWDSNDHPEGFTA